MPEYLAPGVFIEETSFRSKSIEGVSTSTAGFVGPARYGPVSGEPELLTSFADFQRIYGGLDDLEFKARDFTTNHLAHAVRAFFDEGGRRLYVMRVFGAGAKGFDLDGNLVPKLHYARIDLKEVPAEEEEEPPTGEETTETIPAAEPSGEGEAPTGEGTGETIPAEAGIGETEVPVPPDEGVGEGETPSGEETGEESTETAEVQKPIIIARFPGKAGNMRITFALRAGQNVCYDDELGRVQTGDIVWVETKSEEPAETAPDETPPDGGAASDDDAKGKPGQLYVVKWDAAEKKYKLDAGSDSAAQPELTDPSDLEVKKVYPLSVLVTIEEPRAGGGDYHDPTTLGTFTLNLTDELTTTFTRNPERRYDALTIPFAFEGLDKLSANDSKKAIEFTQRLLQNKLAQLDASKLPSGEFVLKDGSDGLQPEVGAYGGATVVKDYSNLALQMEKRGLVAFEGVEDISIVAGPGYTDRKPSDIDQVLGIERALISHCEKMRYRVAVLDTLPHMLPTDALDLRNRTSSKYAAMYYPWVIVADPRPEKAGKRLSLPPSGFVAGIYARNDIEHAVFKAPANEVVRLAIDFETRINTAQQELLNPNAVNCFRFFEGRGFLLWGARTMTDDSEWKYISVRRYFCYLEYSIDRGTQWAVFENNGPQLWNNIRQTIEDFLYNEWRAGGLLGEKPEDAYFVRCDRTTMTQYDLDNGRLVCLVGVAPVRPAEFVIFRIGQWTASSNV